MFDTVEEIKKQFAIKLAEAKKNEKKQNEIIKSKFTDLIIEKIFTDENFKNDITSIFEKFNQNDLLTLINKIKFTPKKIKKIKVEQNQNEQSSEQ